MRAVEFLIDGCPQLSAVEKAYMVFQTSIGDEPDILPLPLHLIWPNPTIDILPVHFHFTPTVFFVALSDGLYCGLANLLMPEERLMEEKEDVAHLYVVKPIGRELVKWSSIENSWDHLQVTLFTWNQKKKKQHAQFPLHSIMPADKVFSALKQQVNNLVLPGSMAIMEPKHDFFSIDHASAFETELADDQNQPVLSYAYDFSVL